MNSKLRLAVLFLFPLLGVSASFPALAQPESKLTPQESVEARQLLAKASSAVAELSRSPDQRNLILNLARTYWQLGDKPAARAEVRTIRKKYEALSGAGASGQSPPAGVPVARIAIMELSDLASEVAQFGDTADALQIMKEIGYQDRGGQTLSMIAIKRAQAGDSEGAVQTVLKIRPGRARDVAFFDVVSYDLQHHDVSGALLAIAQMQSSPEKVQGLVSVSRGQILADHREAATRLVQEAQKVALSLPDIPPPGPQNFTVSYQCSPTASQSPNERESLRGQALPFVAQGQWELGFHAEAMATRKEIQSPYLQDQAIYNFANVDAESGRFAEAARLIEKITARPCRNYANAKLASAEVAAGNITEGIATASGIKPTSSQPWVTLATKVKDPSTAKALFARARAVAASAPSDLDQAEDLAGLSAFEQMQGFHDLACSDGAEAVRLNLQAHAKGQHLPPDIMGFTSGPASYAEVYHMANCGELAQAKAVALKQEGTVREEEVGNVAAVEASSGDIQGAEKWAQSLETPEDRANAFLAVAQAILQRMTTRGHAGR